MTKRSERRALSRKREEQLSAYLDDQLSASERARLETQLAGDPALRAELAALRKTVTLLREMPALPVPRNFILPRSAAPLLRSSRPARPRLAWAAPFLTVATTAVSLLFVVALAGNILVASTGRSVLAPAGDYEALEAPAAEALATVLVQAEVELPVAEEVNGLTEAPVEEAEAAPPPREALPEEAAREEAVPPEEVTEGEQTWAPTEAAMVEEDALQEGAAPQEEPPAPAEPPALEAGAEGEATADDGVSCDPTFESRVATAEMLLGTAAAEKAAGVDEAETTPAAGGGGEATPSPAPTATVAAEPTQREDTASSEPPSDEEPGLSGAAEEAEKTEPPRSATEDREPTVPAPDEQQLRGGGRPFASLPWLAFQIALGSSAIVLLVVTIWAWRVRR